MNKILKCHKKKSTKYKFSCDIFIRQNQSKLKKLALPPSNENDDS